MRFSADLTAAVDLVRAAKGGVRLRAEAGAVTLTGTDGEVGVRATVAADVEAPGECVLPAAAAEIIREVGGRVALALGKTLTVCRDADVWELPTEDPDGQFAMPDHPDPTFVIDGEGLVVAIGRVAFAAAKAADDRARYAAQAVALDVGPKGVHLVATDGKRLAVADLKGVRVPAGVYLFPPRAVELVRKVATGEVEVGVALRENDAFVTSAIGTVWTRLVEGRFAPWRDVVPKGGTTTVELDAPAFARAVRLAALTSDTEARRVTLRLDGEGVRICAAGVPGRSAVAYRPKSFAGPPVTIDFDPGYLADCARGGDALTLTLNGPDKPVVFRGPGWTYLVVPLVA